MHARIEKWLADLNEDARRLVTADANRAMNALGGRPSDHFATARCHYDAGDLTWDSFEKAKSVWR